MGGKNLSHIIETQRSCSPPIRATLEEATMLSHDNAVRSRPGLSLAACVLLRGLIGLAVFAAVQVCAQAQEFTAVPGTTSMQLVLGIQQGETYFLSLANGAQGGGPFQVFDAFNFGPSSIFTGYSQNFGGTNSITPIVGDTPGILAEALGDSCAPFTVFANPGESSAVFQCTYTHLVTVNSIQTEQPLVYLVIAGTTVSPVATVTCLPSYPAGNGPAGCPAYGTGSTTLTNYSGITLENWTAVFQSTPYSPQSFVTVPNVVAETQAAATGNLDAAGLTPQVITQASGTVPAGTVISQIPANPASVPRLWPVQITVSSGPPPIPVPGVIGLSQAAAITALQGAGLTLASVTLVTSSASNEGLVTATNPAVGTYVTAGSAITLTVGTGPATSPQNLTYTGTGSSSSYFSYNIYGGTSVNAYTPGLDAAGNPVTLNLAYNSGGAPGTITCAATCQQTLLAGNGSLIVTTCPPPGPPAVPCSSTQGNLGGAGDTIFAGASLSALNSNSVTSAVIQLTYTQTQFTDASGITYNTPDAPTIYLQLSGNTVRFEPTFALAPVQICYLDPLSGFCGPFGSSSPGGGSFTQGPYFNSFFLDWAATLTATSYGASATVEVPSLAGLTQAAAAAALSMAGLVPGTISQQSSASVPSGEVISQSPPAASQVADGSAVNFVVSSGPPPVAVPNVVGQSQSAATSALSSSGLTLGSVTQQASSAVPVGEVISQSPAAGASASEGSAVALVISSGAAQITIVLAGAPQISAAEAGVTVTVPLLNKGNVSLDALNILGATLNGVAPSSTAVTSLDALAPGATGELVMTFPPPSSAGAAILKANGSYSAGSLSGNWTVGARVQIP